MKNAVQSRYRLFALFAAIVWASLAGALPVAASDSVDALFKSARNGDSDGVERALAQGAPIDARDRNKRTALIVAATYDRLAVVQVLIKRGAKVNLLDNKKYDALTMAAADGRTPIVTTLLAAGANPKLITSPYDGTALIAAAHHGHVQVVRALIKAGAPLDHVNNLTWTAVMESIVLGTGGPRHTRTLELLLEAGANPNLPDSAGVRPLTHAERRGYTEMVRLLKKHGAKR